LTKERFSSDAAVEAEARFLEFQSIVENQGKEGTPRRTSSAKFHQLMSRCDFIWAFFCSVEGFFSVVLQTGRFSMIFK